MDFYVTYLRDQAAQYTKLADGADDPVTADELRELARICQQVAADIEDRSPSG